MKNLEPWCKKKNEKLSHVENKRPSSSNGGGYSDRGSKRKTKKKKKIPRRKKKGSKKLRNETNSIPPQNLSINICFWLEIKNPFFQNRQVRIFPFFLTPPLNLTLFPSSPILHLWFRLCEWKKKIAWCLKEMKQTVKWYSIRRRLNIRRRSSLLGMLWRLRRSRVSCNPSSKFLLGK